MNNLQMLESDPRVLAFVDLAQRYGALIYRVEEVDEGGFVAQRAG